MTTINPIIRQDYPDPDIIRVGDTYYLLSTTMHFFPGGSLLASHDLVNWEIINYLYTDALDSVPGESLVYEQNIYSHGMWAPTLRYHNGTFYALFISIASGRTFIFTAADPSRTWKRTTVKGTYHDASLLFDGDKVYVVYGNREIRITELDPVSFEQKKKGLNITAFTDTHNVGLGYEGSHIYKINGYYYIFNIHWPKTDPAIRTQVVHRAKKIEGPYEEFEMIRDDTDLPGMGVAQGGIVDDPCGNWYGFFFRDNGACGRIPMLTGITFKNGWPTVGKNGKIAPFKLPVSAKPSHRYAPLFTSAFGEKTRKGELRLRKQWQFNHLPDNDAFSFTEDTFTIRTKSLSCNVCEARNTLTQRTFFPGCSAEVTVDATALNEFDHAGLCVLQSNYCELSITKEFGTFYLCLITRDPEDNVRERFDCLPGKVEEKIRLSSPVVRLRIDIDFTDLKDICTFSYKTGRRYEKLGCTHHLRFTLDHFCGARFGVFAYSALIAGGTAVFSDFKYSKED